MAVQVIEELLVKKYLCICERVVHLGVNVGDQRRARLKAHSLLQEEPLVIFVTAVSFDTLS